MAAKCLGSDKCILTSSSFPSSLHAMHILTYDGYHSLQTKLLLMESFTIHTLLFFKVQGPTEIHLSIGFHNIQPEKESRDVSAKHS